MLSLLACRKAGERKDALSVLVGLWTPGVKEEPPNSPHKEPSDKWHEESLARPVTARGDMPLENLCLMRSWILLCSALLVQVCPKSVSPWLESFFAVDTTSSFRLSLYLPARERGNTTSDVSEHRCESNMKQQQLIIYFGSTVQINFVRNLNVSLKFWKNLQAFKSERTNHLLMTFFVVVVVQYRLTLCIELKKGFSISFFLGLVVLSSLLQFCSPPVSVLTHLSSVHFDACLSYDCCHLHVPGTGPTWHPSPFLLLPLSFSDHRGHAITTFSVWHFLLCVALASCLSLGRIAAIDSISGTVSV